MRKRIIQVLAVLFMLAFILFVATGCQTGAKSLGGTVTINLEPGLKLEEITWKDNNLWYLTREMREDEFAETHKFKQSSEFGIIEGLVVIVEHEKGDQ